jgi:hypothetical protein
LRFALGNPALLWGLAAALIPVAIHLFYRRRPKPVAFPAIDFILKARKETSRRLRLRKLLLFAARTLLLLAIAAAILRPRAIRPEDLAAVAPRGPAATALVLDASASMGYRKGGGTLFDKARSDLLDALDGLNADEPVTALVCGGVAAPAAPPPGFDKAAVRRLLSEAQLTAGFADLTACAGAAVRALADSAAGQALGKRLVVATDLTGSGWRLDAPPPVVATPAGPVRPEVSLLDAARGAALPNVAITALEAEPDPAVGPRGYRVTATLVNHGKEPVKDLTLQLKLGLGKDTQVAVRGFVDLPASGSLKKTLSHNFLAGGPTVVTVAVKEDDLAIDDQRSLTLAVPREVKALVVDGKPSPVKLRDEAFFVEAALQSPASPVRPTVVDAEGLESAKLADYDVVFLLNVHSVAGKTAELKAFVEKGGGLFVALGDQVDPDVYEQELGALLPQPLHVVKTAAERGTSGAADRAARFGTIDWEHPALSIFTGPAREGFEGVRTYRYMLLKPAGPSAKAHVVASYDDGAPALVEAKRGAGRVLLFTSTGDREWSDWAIRTSFLPSVQRFAAWLTGALEAAKDAPSLVLAPRPLPGEEGRKLVALVDPDGKELPPPASPPGGKATFVPERPGVWQVKMQDAAGTKLDPRLAFAVQPDPRESDTARLDPVELTAYFGGASHAKVAGEKPPAQSEHSIPLWSILLALGLAALLAEGALVA